MRIGLALRAFWNVLQDAEIAAGFEQLLASPGAATADEAAGPPKSQPPPRPADVATTARSDALVLLESLQREARLVDLVKEPLANYGDTEVGAAARDVLRKSGEVLERFFGLEPISTDTEGSPCEVAAGFDPGRIRLTGNVAGEPPYQGVIGHHGWVATRCELPEYRGSDEASLVVAPFEVEVK